jgi:hypothetical protein
MGAPERERDKPPTHFCNFGSPRRAHGHAWAAAGDGIRLAIVALDP